jgi:hypothetical protein
MAPKRRRFTPVAVATGLLGAVLLSVSMTGTLSGFVASIQNSTNTAATGSLTMEEKTTSGPVVTCLSTDGGSVYTNSATCSTINKFGGSTTLVPGAAAGNTAITIKNTGTLNAATFTLTPGLCTQTVGGVGAATNLCSKINVVITSGVTTIFSGTAAGLAAGGIITIAAPPAAGVSVPFNFAVSLDTTADNTYQGLQASLPLTWKFTS